MFKYFILFFTIFFSASASIIHAPGLPNNPLPFGSFLPELPTKGIEEIVDKWQGHLMDFLNMIDLEKVMGVVMKHISNPDVINFAGFISSPDFKQLLVKFGDIEEFKEAVQHLESKGYEVKPIIDLIASQLSLPSLGIKTTPRTTNNGVTTLITEILQVLPIEDMKKLFEEKVEKHEEVKELFETLSSEEFVDILKRLIVNPKFLEIKQVFASYGLNLDSLRIVAEDIFGDYVNEITRKVLTEA